VLRGAQSGARATGTGAPAIGPIPALSAHLAGRDDGLVRVQPLIDRAPRFADLLEPQINPGGARTADRAARLYRDRDPDCHLCIHSRVARAAVAAARRGKQPLREAGPNRDSILGDCASRQNNNLIDPLIEIKALLSRGAFSM
jgi:hypothetical protein